MIPAALLGGGPRESRAPSALPGVTAVPHTLLGGAWAGPQDCLPLPAAWQAGSGVRGLLLGCSQLQLKTTGEATRVSIVTGLSTWWPLRPLQQALETRLWVLGTPPC